MRKLLWRHPAGRGWTAAFAAFVVAGCGGGTGGGGAPGTDSAAAATSAVTAVQLKAAEKDKLLEIRTVNNRADLVSDGDALVELVLPERAALPSLKVTLN